MSFQDPLTTFSIWVKSTTIYLLLQGPETQETPFTPPSPATSIIPSIDTFPWFYLLYISLICPFYSLLTHSTASPGETTAMALLSWLTLISIYSYTTLICFLHWSESWGSFKNRNLIISPLLNTFAWFLSVLNLDNRTLRFYMVKLQHHLLTLWALTASLQSSYAPFCYKAFSITHLSQPIQFYSFFRSQKSHFVPFHSNYIFVNKYIKFNESVDST